MNNRHYSANEKVGEKFAVRSGQFAVPIAIAGLQIAYCLSLKNILI